jgi:hypothetical protein
MQSAVQTGLAGKKLMFHELPAMLAKWNENRWCADSPKSKEIKLIVYE